MAEMSNYLRNQLVNATLRGTSYSTPSTVYVALYTTDPTAGDTGIESVLGAYARVPVTFTTPNNGNSSNSNNILFPVVTSGTEVVTHIGIRDALTGGNLLYFTPLNESASLATGNQYEVAIGQLTVALS